MCRPPAWLLLIAGAVCLLASGSESMAADAPPNLIYILLDDAGYGDLSCYGQKKFTTPNIDRMAAEGMRFTDHYAGSTVCAPTRCALMTGQHTGHCVVRGNREVQPEGQAPMPADTVTLPRLLARAGYATGMFGKWGLGAPGSTSDPMEHFSRFYGYNCQRQAHTYYPGHLWSDRTRIPLDGRTYSHDLIVRAAFEFIRSRAQKQPFFCYLPVTIPHAAMHVPEEDAAPFRDQFSQFEDRIGRYRGPEVRNPAAAFAGMMTRLDRHVGELLALLDELGIEENTLVMLTSDNGPHKEGGHLPDFFDSNGPFRGHKRDLYEGGIRVPLIARWPGKIQAGTMTDLISAHWDTLPTFCELAGVETPDGRDGVSLVPTLLGTGRQLQHDFLYWEFTERGSSQAVRMGKWKGVRTQLKKNPQAPLELYDLAADPAETTNLAASHPDVVHMLQDAMNSAHVESATFPLFDRRRSR